MKNLKKIIIGLISLFIGVVPVLAESSKFEATINMEPEITENQINLILGFRGEEAMAVTETITYDSTRVSLLDIVSIDNFTVTTGVESIDGKWHTINFLADSMYSFTDANYAVAVFEVKDNFKIDNDSDIFLYNIEASGPDKTKFRYRGDYVSLNRESASLMYMSTTPIKDGAKINYYLKKYLLLAIVSIIAIVALIVLIIICIPNFRKKENRTKDVNNSINSDNYKSNKNMQPININQEEIDKMNDNKKVIDLNEAIVVSDVKPFNDNPSRDEIGGRIEDNKKIEVPFDPFNVKLEDMSTMNVQEITPKPQEPVDELPAKKKEAQNNDLKAPILSTDFTDDVNEITLDDDNDNKTQSSNNNINNILLLLAISLVSLFSISVNALEGEELPIVDDQIVETNPVVTPDDDYLVRLDDLRDCIVGNIPFDETLDYNNDGKVDVLDIVYTRNTVNVNFEELLKTEPGFKELHGQSPNILGSKVTTTKVVINKNKTTSRKTTIINGNNRTTSKKTTTSKTTTIRTTTEKTTKQTTIEMPIDESITYQVNVNAANGFVNNSSTMAVGSGKSATFTVVPNTGFEYDSVTCTNGVKATYSKTSRSLKVASIKTNTTCTVSFAPRTDIKVSVNPTNGSSSPKSAYVTFGGTTQFTVKPNTGYAYSPNSLSCSNGITGTYNGNTLTVNNVTTDTTCSLTFTKQLYTVRVYVNNDLVDTQSIPYNETYKGEITISSNKGTLKCNDASVSASKSNLTENLYVWTFSRRITENMNCYLTFS